jgi:anti-sigma regulatory factor (Ser/Thr protein kinase)
MVGSPGAKLETNRKALVMSERFLLKANRHAPSHARKAITRPCDDLSAKQLYDLSLLTSELVANSVRHAGLDTEADIELVVSPSADCVRIEVLDAGPGFDANESINAGEEDSLGLGLALVDQLADRWGVETESHTRVWFEVDVKTGILS